MREKGERIFWCVRLTQGPNEWVSERDANYVCTFFGTADDAMKIIAEKQCKKRLFHRRSFPSAFKSHYLIIIIVIHVKNLFTERLVIE